MKSMQNLATLVTGAGRGIGAAIALRYAREGANVFVTDLDERNAHAVAEQARALGVQADAMVSDVSDPAQCTAMIERAVARFGRLDVLVNNAGVIRVRTFLDTTPADWDFIHGVNTRGSFFAMQAGVRQMLKQAPMAENRPRGKIINIASIAGRIGRPLMAAYAASKAAAISLTKSAALEFAPDITVNSICPGVVGTDMWKQIDAESTKLQQRPPGAAWDDRVRGVPLQRAETPEDVAGIAAFLAGRDADYITAQSYHIDGGLVPN